MSTFRVSRYRYYQAAVNFETAKKHSQRSEKKTKIQSHPIYAND